MDDKNTQVEAYHDNRQLKEHHKDLIYLLKRDYSSFSGRLMDIGCADGKFLAHLRDNFPEATLIGIDADKELIASGREQYEDLNLQLHCGDAIEYSPPEDLDIITASGIMGVFEDFRLPLSTWLRWLSEDGTLYVFERFNSRSIDTKIKFRNHHTDSDWESGLNSYSINTVGDYLDSQGYDYRFKEFELGMNIDPSENPIRTWTETLEDGSRMVINGANVIAEHYHMIVE
jgi:trans-aconitate methyltransferase